MRTNYKKLAHESLAILNQINVDNRQCFVTYCPGDGVARIKLVGEGQSYFETDGIRFKTWRDANEWLGIQFALRILKSV